MGKVANIILAILDGFIVLGLLLKVLFGDADVVDYIGLAAVILYGISCIHSLVSKKNIEDADI